MILKLRTLLLIASLILILCGCASAPVCERHQPLHDSPAPAPEAFSKCLREIVAVGKGQQDQISSDCSTLLQLGPTK